MANLNSSNCSVDEKSGAVIYHKSPELLEIMKLRQEVKNLNSKMDLILEYLKGGKVDGETMD